MQANYLRNIKFYANKALGFSCLDSISEKNPNIHVVKTKALKKGDDLPENKLLTVRACVTAGMDFYLPSIIGARKPEILHWLNEPLVISEEVKDLLGYEFSIRADCPKKNNDELHFIYHPYFSSQKIGRLQISGNTIIIEGTLGNCLSGNKPSLEVIDVTYEYRDFEKLRILSDLQMFQIYGNDKLLSDHERNQILNIIETIQLIYPEHISEESIISIGWSFIENEPAPDNLIFWDYRCYKQGGIQQDNSSFIQSEDDFLK